MRIAILAASVNAGRAVGRVLLRARSVDGAALASSLTCD